METNELINIATIMQGVQTLLIGAILFHFYLSYGNNYLRLWALSWLAYSVYFFGSIIGVYLTPQFAPTDAPRLLTAAVYLTAGYLQVPLLLAGIYELTVGKTVSRQRMRLFLGIACGAGLCVTVGSAFAEVPLMRFFLRVGVNALIFGCGFVYAAYGVSRVWGTGRETGRGIVMYGFLTYGFYQFAHAALPLLPSYLPAASIPPLLVYFVFTESVLLLWTGLGMVIWLLEEERDRAASADAALKASESLFRKLTENNAAGIFIIQDALIRYINQTAAAILRRDREDLLNQPLLDFVHADFKMRVDLNYQRLLAGEILPRGEAKIVNRRGDEFWIDSTGVKIDFEGAPAVLVTIIDITERKAAQEKLMQTQRLESIGMLAGGMAHDFNNMLTGMIGFSELALRKLPADDAAARNVQKVKDLCHRAAELTRQLLAFARRQMLEMKPVDVNEVAVETVDFLRHVIGENIEIETSLAPDLYLTVADAAQLQQVLTNLALNARDAMPDGGKISITTRNVDDALGQDIHTSSFSSQRSVEITVSDTGAGISPDVQKRIFEPFFTTKQLGRGTGLGLAMVYGIVKQHNGIINVTSADAKGSTFRIYLPASELTAPKLTNNDNGDAPALGAETILVAEDEQSLREMINEVLTADGYRVILAADGAEALNLFDRHAAEINLVITDAVMPKLGGEGVYKSLQTRPAPPPVLFISGYGLEISPHNWTNGIELLRKPFDSAALRRKVRQMFSVKV